MLSLVYVLVTAAHDAGLVLVRVAVIVGFQAFLVAVVLLSIAAGGGQGGDEPGSDDDDDGPGRHRPEPRRPPPEPFVSWPDFERQFAEYVEAMRGRDKAPAA